MRPPHGGAFGPAKAGMMIPPGGRPGPYAEPGAGQAQVNDDGLPVRPGKEDCLVYLNTGVCQNGLACIFNHPRGGGSKTGCSGALPKPGGTALGPQGMPPRATGPLGHPLGSPLGGPCSGRAAASATKAVVDGGAPSSPSLRAKPPPGMPAARAIGDTPPGMPRPVNAGADDDGKEEKATELQFNEAGLPLRPDAQKCGSYLRGGKCALGRSCRFDHPEGLAGIMAGPSGFGNFPLLVGTPQTADAGLARRPGKDQCPFLKRTGECPFGQECRFDHAPGTSGGGGTPAPMGNNKDRGLGGARGRRPVCGIPRRS